MKQGTVLTDDEREHVPGWLLRLIDSEDVKAIEYAERHCSDSYFRQILKLRREELGRVWECK